MNIKIPGYEVLGTLGSGGMAIVYLARDVKLGRKVAIKILLENLSLDPLLRERFFNEARMMAGLTHPNIVTLHDYIEFGDRLALVMEYVGGQTLDERIGKVTGAIPYERALVIFNQILSAVRYAHSRGIVHRDLKPSNILFSSDGTVKVSDFGIAKITGEKGLTGTGTRKPGSIYYMPPEAIHGKESTPQSDVYSLGITLYEMLSGVMPFDRGDTSELQTMLAITEGDMPDPRTFYPHIPSPIVDVVFKAIDKEPSNRFSDCDEFMVALNNACNTGSVASVLSSASLSSSSLSSSVAAGSPSSAGNPVKSGFPWKKIGLIGVPVALLGVLLALIPWGSEDDPVLEYSFVTPPDPSLAIVDSIPRGPYLEEITTVDFVGDDRIAVLDYVNEAGYLFDSSGDYVAELAFADTPAGDVEMAMGITGMRDGRIAVSDWKASEILFFSDTGEYLDNLSGYPLYPPAEIFSNSDGSITGTDLYMADASTAGYRICRWLTTEEPALVYCAFMGDLNRSSTSSRVEVYSGLPLFCVSDSGCVYMTLSYPGRYDVTGYQADKEFLFNSGMNVEPVLRDSVAISSELNRALRLTGLSNSGWQPDSLIPAAVAMGVDSFGRLWVQRGTSDTPVFDLFDSVNGDVLMTLEFPELAGWRFRISSGGMLAFPGNTDQPQVVYMVEVNNDPAERDAIIAGIGSKLF